MTNHDLCDTNFALHSENSFVMDVKRLVILNSVLQETHYSGARCSSVVRAFAHGVTGRRIDPSWWSYFSFQPVLYDWCNKDRGMCYPVCGMMHVKESLLLIRKSSPCGSSRFPYSLSEYSFTICLTPYNRKIKCVECVIKQTISFLPYNHKIKCVECVVKPFPSFLPYNLKIKCFECVIK